MNDQSDTAEREEGRLKQAAFVTLFGMMSGHALLETARDALFLTNVPAERLPWVYLSIAVVAVFFARLQVRSNIVANRRQQLIALQGIAAITTLGFWAVLPSDAVWLYYALYIWSGVIGSVLVVTFWLVLGDLFTITQGKRIYASIGTGGAAGAIAGFGAAAALTVFLPAEFLLPVSAFAFASSVVGPWTSLRSQLQEPLGGVAETPAPKLTRAEPGLIASMSDILDHPYACRVAALVVVSAMTLTLGDYLFKSVLADIVAAESLAVWLARIYFVLNATSLLFLMFGVTRLIRRFSVHRALTVLPAFISLAAVGILAGGALIPVLFLKVADGTLRYSLQKTASELLYLPMPAELRAKVKGTIDIVGQRSANAIAALLILLALWMGSSTILIASAVLLLSVVWVLLALDLRGAYLDVFREALSEGTIETRVDVPELDLASLETLIRALNHPDDRHVLAALDLLEAKGRVELIPTLILYHPSADVVVRALDLFTNSGRRDFSMLAERLLESDDSEIRAATVRAIWAVEPDRGQLEALLDEECICVRTSAVIGLLVNDWIDRETARERIQEAIQYPHHEARLALANAFKLHHIPEFREPMEILARDASPVVRKEALRAIRASKDESYIPLLVQLLNDRSIRENVRIALCELGDAALDELSRVLARENVSLGLQLHIPRSISRFHSIKAAEVLLHELTADHGLDGEPRDRHSGMVRYKILRGLGPILLSTIGEHVDKSPLRSAIARTIRRVIQNLHWQIWLEHGREADSSRQTCGSYLLLQLLHDKERLALQRIFRMLYLIQPEENFRHIWLGLQSASRQGRASSLELLDNILGAQQRQSVMALVGSGSTRERLEQSGSDLADVVLEYSELLVHIGRDQSRALNGLAMYHASEIGLDEAGSTGLSLREQALALIEEMPEFRPGPRPESLVGGVANV
ncbi:MAG: HEAT repeat domain-containing protein [Deltaproteobacteria bacterium]|nr:HEAT repeat domain-containing protein [Deltaproteobacteria bacterium]